MPSIKADKWIRKMALEHGMIEPFEDRQVREGVISYGLSSYGYDIRVADEFKVFTNINNTVVDPKNFDARSFVDMKTDVCIIPPNSFALAQDGRVFPHPARRPDGLRRQVHLRALRPDRQRHAVRARVGGLRHARDLEHDAAAGQGLRQRRHLAGAVLPERRDLRGLLRGQEGQVPEAAGADAAAAVMLLEFVIVVQHWSVVGFLVLAHRSPWSIGHGDYRFGARLGTDGDAARWHLPSIAQSPRAACATSFPEDVRRREYVIGVIRRVYERYGFEPLETPAVENLETLMGKYGEEGNQLIFKILKRGEHEASGQADLALRYDLTVPLARVVAHHQASCRSSSSATRFSRCGAPIVRRAGASASSISATSTRSARRRR